MDVRSSRAEMFLSDGLDILRPASRLLLGGDDRAPGALDDGHDLGPLGRRTANLSSVCATSSMKASHSPGVMRRYLKPAGGTSWCASSTKGLALSRWSVIT